MSPNSTLITILRSTPTVRISAALGKLTSLCTKVSYLEEISSVYMTAVCTLQSYKMDNEGHMGCDKTLQLAASSHLWPST